MNAIAAPRPAGTNIVTAEQAAAIKTALKTSLYPGASDASVELVLSYCKASGYDPMKKPVHIVQMKVATGRKDDRGFEIKENRDVIMPGIGQYRTDAARTGQYAGCSEPEFGPLQTLHFKREVWSGSGNSRSKKQVDATLEYPEWCKVTVTKLVDGKPCEFTAVEYWLENYATKGDDGAPNAMWEKRPRGQLAKCTEAQALRKAFPENVGSQPTAEEMEGKDTIEGDYTVVSTGVAMPQAKQESPKSEPANSDSGAADPAAGGEASAAGDASPQGAGIHGLTAGQQKILATKAKNAGLLTEGGDMDEDALLRLHPLITKDNLNDVLADLQKRAEAQDAG